MRIDRFFSLMPARWVHAACIVLLLVAQHAALTHVAWHHAAPPAHHLEDAAASSEPAACDFDETYAQVLGAAGVAVCLVALPRRPDVAPDTAVRTRFETDFLPYRSRGPPVFPF